MKYTAVIPTMLKSPRLKKLVEELQNHQLVDEIIIIDNSGNLEPSFQLSSFRFAQNRSLD